MLPNEAWLVEREALLNEALIVNGEEVLSDEAWIMEKKRCGLIKPEL